MKPEVAGKLNDLIENEIRRRAAHFAWRTIDTAPFGKAVLVVDPAFGVCLAKGHAAGYWHDGSSALRPTHWMPIPEIPTQGGVVK